MMRTLLILLAGLVVALAAAGFWLKHQVYAPQAVPPALARLEVRPGVPWQVLAEALESGRLFSAYPVVLRIKPGVKWSALVTQLKARGLIRSAVVFRYLAQFTGKKGRHKHGIHYFHRPLNAVGVLAEIVKPGRKAEQNVVLIPPGKNIWEVAAILDEKGVVDQVKFVRLAFDPVFVKSLGLPGTSVEGYLYPDTYDMPRGKGARWAITKMVNRFLAAYKTLQPLARRRGLSMDQVVILASIVVKEAGPGERKRIASVILNRLNHRDRRGRLTPMPLAMDPTIIYGLLLVKNRDRLRRAAPNNVDFAVTKGFNLTKAHLQDPRNPYNTYQHPGLPPSPIASPGLASLQAVLQPDQTPYLYFVAKQDGTKTHHFSTGPGEHALAVNCYQRRIQASCRRLRRRLERRSGP